MILQKVFIQIIEESTYLGDLTIRLNPVACPRPRISKYGAYYPKKYTAWKQLAKDSCPCGQLRSEDPLLVLVEHVVSRPKKPSNPFPHPDLDNYDKSAYDAVTSLNGYWQDDKQVVTGMSWKRYAKEGEEPGTHIEFYKMKRDRL